MIGVYPGSFNPLTLAHLGIAAAARDRHRLDRVDLVLSVRALEKEHVDRPLWRDRLADLAEGYDVLIMGADKWHQVLDVRYYAGSGEARDAAVARLPRLAIAPRPPLEVPADLLLEVEDRYADMSS